MGGKEVDEEVREEDVDVVVGDVVYVTTDVVLVVMLEVNNLDEEEVVPQAPDTVTVEYRVVVEVTVTVPGTAATTADRKPMKTQRRASFTRILQVNILIPLFGSERICFSPPVQMKHRILERCLPI